MSNAYPRYDFIFYDCDQANKNPLLSFFGPQETEVDPPTPPPEPSSCSSPVPKCQQTFAEYLSSPHSTLRSKEECNKSQKFRAHLWLCEDYPLSLQEQVMPIVDLLAISNTHFQKLKHFIHMQLPSGFTVKIGDYTHNMYLAFFHFPISIFLSED